MINTKLNNTTTEKPYSLIIGGIGLLRSLAEADIPFYVGSDIRENPSLYSRYCKHKVTFSNYVTPIFVEELCSFGKSMGQKIAFFSDDDRAILTFSEYRDKLSPYFYFNFPDKSIVDGILDKQKFASLAQRLKLPVPKSFVPLGIDNVNEMAKDLSYPCILKPAHKEDWWHPEFKNMFGTYRKAIECNDKAELLKYYQMVAKINPHVVIQELVVGDDSQLFSVNLYLNRNTELQAHFIAHKLRTYPIHAGIGCLVETIYDDELLELSLLVAKKMNIQGFCNIQFKRDSRTGGLKLLEIHVRNSVWSYLGTASGVNMLAVGYYDMVGLKYPWSKQYKAGVKFMDLKRDFLAILDYHKTGEWKYGQWLKSLKGKRVYFFFSWKDPLPFFADLWFSSKKKRGNN